MTVPPLAGSVVLYPMSGTHNEFRLAACPLSGDQERVRAPVN
jgi:hypothetical protein